MCAWIGRLGEVDAETRAHGDMVLQIDAGLDELDDAVEERPNEVQGVS